MITPLVGGQCCYEPDSQVWARQCDNSIKTDPIQFKGRSRSSPWQSQTMADERSAAKVVASHGGCHQRPLCRHDRRCEPIKPCYRCASKVQCVPIQQSGLIPSFLPGVSTSGMEGGVIRSTLSDACLLLQSGRTPWEHSPSGIGRCTVPALTLSCRLTCRLYGYPLSFPFSRSPDCCTDVPFPSFPGAVLPPRSPVTVGHCRFPFSRPPPCHPRSSPLFPAPGGPRAVL